MGFKNVPESISTPPFPSASTRIAAYGLVLHNERISDDARAEAVDIVMVSLPQFFPAKFSVIHFPSLEKLNLTHGISGSRPQVPL
jgi:hypothetical protein